MVGMATRETCVYRAGCHESGMQYGIIKVNNELNLHDLRINFEQITIDLFCGSLCINDIYRYLLV